MADNVDFEEGFRAPNVHEEEPIPKGIIVGVSGSGKTTLLKNLMSKAEREKYEEKLKTGVRNSTKEFPSFEIDVSWEQKNRKLRIFDSPPFGDGDMETSVQTLAMASKLFGEQDFSFVVVVVPTTEARIGLKSQILKLVLEEGLLRAPGNIDIHKQILIVGTKVDRLDYEEDLVPWKETIAPHLLHDPDTNQPLGCPIVTSSITGRGTEKRPYDAKIDDVKKWLCTVSTDIINGQKADQNRFEKGLQKIFGMDFSLHSLRAAALDLENMKENRGIEAWRIVEPEPSEPELQNYDVKSEFSDLPDTKEEEEEEEESESWAIVKTLRQEISPGIVAGTSCSILATATGYVGVASAEEGAVVAASSMVLPIAAQVGAAFVVGYTGYHAGCKVFEYMKNSSRSHDS